MLKHHSSRRQPLDKSVLSDALAGAKSYDRIAGYFRSSLFEVAGEAINQVEGKVRIICNSDCDPSDLETAAAAQAALRKSWCKGEHEQAPLEALPRYQALYDALVSEKVEVRVLPDSAFGLIHGKAGLIRKKDGNSTAFLGSVNESKSAWQLNYELLWEDDSAETIAWIEEEFNALWEHPQAIPLAQCPAIEKDVLRTIQRKVVEPHNWGGSHHSEDADDDAAAAAVETPVYRKEQGLWPHQKYFSKLALERHRLGGARLVLADQVGLGKTIQLAMAALLMAVDEPEGGPILVLAPKPLLEQWQDELMELLHLPSARWSGSAWIDENGVEHPKVPEKTLTACPRRIGLISQGLVVRGNSKAIHQLLSNEYTCVIVDEAHRSRRRNIPAVDAGEDAVNEAADPNKLMEFLRQIGPKTKSMLLATATPVQLHPVEAWDLLHTLSHGHDGVLGGWTQTSPWFRSASCLDIASGARLIPETAREGWEYVRDPLPTHLESEDIARLRQALDAETTRFQFSPESLSEIPIARQRANLEGNLLSDNNYARKHNPLLRCIVRRTRKYLEDTINPVTNSYYLPKVLVKLFGEGEDDSLDLGEYLRDAYEEAENFSKLLQQRVQGAGFFRTLLLRRLGSSMEAGRRTICKLLGREPDDLDDEEDDFDDSNEAESLPSQVGRPSQADSEFKNFTTEEFESLERCLGLLRERRDQDPKLNEVLAYLLGDQTPDERWMDLGCILFSQYYDTVRWIGSKLAEHPSFVGMEIGLYAGSNRSGIWRNGEFQRVERDRLKQWVREGRLKLLLGTDAASEGLNLQKLSTLINIDLPWNPTRLEQRKGRIQRIGQAREEVWIANLRYRDSVEDRVHQVLADRLAAIHELFGQIPDTLEDVWVELAMGNEDAANQLIDRTRAARNPFDEKYSKVEDADWESCARVLNPVSVNELLSLGWKK